MNKRIGNFELNPKADIDGTSFYEVTVTVNPWALSRLLGEAHVSDEYKVSREWVFVGPYGAVITLYDWKETSLYDPEYPSPREFWAGARVTLHLGHDALHRPQALELAALLEGACK